MVDLHGMVCYSDEMEDLEAAEKLYGVWGNEEHRPKIRRTRRGEDQRQTRDLVPRLREFESPSIYSVTRYGQC